MRRVIVAVAAMVAAACSSSPPTPPPANPPLPAPPATAFPPTSLLCRVADDFNGAKATYYLEIHSAAFDFSPCNAGIARIVVRPADLNHPDAGLAPGPRHGCTYSGTTDRSVNGVITVFTTFEPANLATVDALCAAHHGLGLLSVATQPH